MHFWTVSVAVDPDSYKASNTFLGPLFCRSCLTAWLNANFKRLSVFRYDTNPGPVADLNKR